MNSKFFLFILILSFYTTLSAQPPSIDYRLVFSDHFSDGLITNDTWWQVPSDPNQYCENDPEDGQGYTRNNISETNGKLTITSREETIVCEGQTKYWTSGRLSTMSTFRYGYFEVKAKIPSGNGLFPALWLFPTTNIPGYQEIDIMEACGCNCNEYQPGYYFDDLDGITDDNEDHTQYKTKVRTRRIDICKTFNKYGVEWTPSEIIFYFNGNIVATFDNNNNNHSHMHLIINTAINGGFNGCGWTSCPTGNLLNWEMDTDPSCHVTCHTAFPQTFEIDYVKVWQKENTVVYIKGDREICIGSTTKLTTPYFSNATYSWSASSGLQVASNQYANLDEGTGVWAAADVTALSSGSQIVTLTVSFEGGYTETQTFPIQVLNSAPSAPNDISYSLTFDIPYFPGDCCYYIQTTDNIGAATYNWTVNGTNYTTYDNWLDTGQCYSQGYLNLTVNAQNICGQSSSYQETIYLPEVCSDDSPPIQMRIVPNPALHGILLEFMSGENRIAGPINGTVIIRDQQGLIVKTLQLVDDEQIDIHDLQNGIYYLLFVNEDITLASIFIKE